MEVKKNKMTNSVELTDQNFQNKVMCVNDIINYTSNLVAEQKNDELNIIKQKYSKIIHNYQDNITPLMCEYLKCIDKNKKNDMIDSYYSVIIGNNYIKKLDECVAFMFEIITKHGQCFLYVHCSNALVIL